MSNKVLIKNPCKRENIDCQYANMLGECSVIGCLKEPSAVSLASTPSPILNDKKMNVTTAGYKMLLGELNFGEAFEFVKKGCGMRLPSWKEDVIIFAQYPDKNSKMTAPYLYVQSRFGRVPWKETMIELFSEEWQVVEVCND